MPNLGRSLQRSLCTKTIYRWGGSFCSPVRRRSGCSLHIAHWARGPSTSAPFGYSCGWIKSLNFSQRVARPTWPICWILSVGSLTAIRAGALLAVTSAGFYVLIFIRWRKHWCWICVAGRWFWLWSDTFHLWVQYLCFSCIFIFVGVRSCATASPIVLRMSAAIGVVKASVSSMIPSILSAASRVSI